MLLLSVVDFWLPGLERLPKQFAMVVFDLVTDKRPIQVKVASDLWSLFWVVGVMRCPPPANCLSPLSSSHVSPEQYRHRFLCLTFTVMDYDWLSTNDFAGEAVAPLSDFCWPGRPSASAAGKNVPPTILHLSRSKPSGMQPCGALSHLNPLMPKMAAYLKMAAIQMEKQKDW